MTAMLARHTVGVMGSGTETHEALAQPVGDLLADLGVNLLTGGGAGVMTAVSRAFVQHPRARGICIGVIPCEDEAHRSAPRRGYPNAYVELPIFTHLPYSGREGTHDLSRNHINVLSCSAIVALPGGDGTASEVSLAVRYRRPVIVFSTDSTLVAHFPVSAERTSRLDRVRDFVLACIGADGSVGFPA